MKKVFLFNPENDIALASGHWNFTPPAAGRDMAVSGQALPWWLGGKDDYVLVPDASDARLEGWRERIERHFGPGPQFINSLRGVEIDVLEPWGWSSYTCKVFDRFGAGKEMWQSHWDDAEIHRRFSHRRTAMELRLMLGEDGITEARSMQDVRDFAESYSDFYVKAPWSSSGRGVFRYDSVREAGIEGIMRRQGSVMLEKSYDGVRDFAMLFWMGEDGLSFCGYSMFFNGGTTYGGNMLASDEEIEHRLAAMAGGVNLDATRRAVSAALEEIAAAHGYRGPLGVDMLVYRCGDGSYRIASCIEVNCRYTMGFIAHAVAARGLRGHMAVNSLAPSEEKFTYLSPPIGKYHFFATY